MLNNIKLPEEQFYVAESGAIFCCSVTSILTNLIPINERINALFSMNRTGICCSTDPLV